MVETHHLKPSGVGERRFCSGEIEALSSIKLPTIAYAATEPVEKLGLEVFIAENGLESVEFLKDNQVDLVLMDLQMPVMGGIEATIEIRKLFPERDIPIIAMTANAMEGHKNQCFEAGMDDYITKPIRFNLIKDLIERTLINKCLSKEGD